jgi:hypothetical protein
LNSLQSTIAKLNEEKLAMRDEMRQWRVCAFLLSLLIAGALMRVQEKAEAEIRKARAERDEEEKVPLLFLSRCRVAALIRVRSAIRPASRRTADPEEQYGGTMAKNEG